jgi:hypothetical protein
MTLELPARFLWYHLRSILWYALTCGQSCVVTTPSAAQSPQPRIIVKFDSVLSRLLTDNHVLQPESYQYAISSTLQSWYPRGDNEKRELLAYIAAARSDAGELGMAAEALVPFHDPATVSAMLARARNDSLPPFVGSYIIRAAAAVLSMGDVRDSFRNVHDPIALARMTMLENFADQAMASSIGHVYAQRLRQVFDASQTARSSSSDDCEATNIAAGYLIGTLDLHDVFLLQPIFEAAPDCATVPLLLALSYVSDIDLISAADTVGTLIDRRTTAEHAASAAISWWHAYLRVNPNGDWRPAARAALDARGYKVRGASSSVLGHELMRALDDSSPFVRYKALRLLNDMFSTHLDLDPICETARHSMGLSGLPAGTDAYEAQLRAYWKRRVDST